MTSKTGMIITGVCGVVSIICFFINRGLGYPIMAFIAAAVVVGCVGVFGVWVHRWYNAKV